jgi:3-hydroxyisobutyrate dehydrogenase-like beta-hydroxyacid dehydrogenase
MALNLVKAGFELVVHDINPARVAPLVAAGATVEASGDAVAAKCHRTICMVDDARCHVGGGAKSAPGLPGAPSAGARLA